jgi:hypothetical protein
VGSSVGAGAQPPERDWLAEPGWRPGDDLTSVEEEMCAKTATGELTDRGEGPFELTEMETWGTERTVRAAVLRHLLIDEEWPVSAKGVRMRGIRIGGHLDLEAATFRCPLSLADCYFDVNKAAFIDHATASIVTLTRCRLAGLSAEGLSAKSLDVSGSTFTAIVELTGAVITDQLVCRGSTLTGRDEDGKAFVADRMKVAGDAFLDQKFTTTDGSVQMLGVDVGGQLSFVGALLNGRDNDNRALVADGIRAKGGVFFTELTAAGSIRMLAADIGNQLTCRGAQLHGRDNTGDALATDGMKVRGGIFLHGLSTSSGAVRLTGADISGPLVCTDAQLTGRDGLGNALIADRMRVGSGVSLNGQFTADGAVRLAGADITGQLVCRGAQLYGRDYRGDTLAAYGIRVSDGVFVDGGFTAAGTVSFAAARFGRSMEFKPATLAGAGRVALDMSGAQVADALWWAPTAQVSGRVDLEGASFGELADDWGEGRSSANGYWPIAGALRLNGFTYDRLGGDRQPSVEHRLGWVRSQYSQDRPKSTALWTNGIMAPPIVVPPPARGPAKAGRSFTPEPYEQLAKVYRQAGKDGDARKVAIARRVDERRYGNLDTYRKAGNWFFDKTIKFGYQTWRAALGLVVVFVAFLVMSLFAQHHHAIVPVNDLAVGVHPVPVATRCASSYPCFYPLGYTVDVVIPVINLHQADFWGLDGWGWVVGSWTATVLGWAAVTLLVVGYTGLVRQQ